MRARRAGCFDSRNGYVCWSRVCWSAPGVARGVTRGRVWAKTASSTATATAISSAVCGAAPTVAKRHPVATAAGASWTTRARASVCPKTTPPVSALPSAPSRWCAPPTGPAATHASETPTASPARHVPQTVRASRGTIRLEGAKGGWNRTEVRGALPTAPVARGPLGGLPTRAGQRTLR